VRLSRRILSADEGQRAIYGERGTVGGGCAGIELKKKSEKGNLRRLDVSSE